MTGSRDAVRCLAFVAVLALAVAAVTAGAAAAATTEAATQEDDQGELDGEGTADDPYVITSAEELQAIDQDLEAHYVLEDDVDASGTASWNDERGLEPIGGLSEPFTGTLDGQGHAIVGLRMDRSGDRDVGLFVEQQGTIRDLRVEDAFVRGNTYVGTLAARNRGEITGVTVSTDLRGYEFAGGIAGTHEGELRDSTVHGTVDSSDAAGGAVANGAGLVARSGSTATVSGDEYVGGLVGTASSAIEIRSSYGTGAVEGSHTVGGLVGNLPNSGDHVSDSYALGDVTGDDERAGGLVGRVGAGTVESSFAAGEVDSWGEEGGLIGYAGNPDGEDLYWSAESSAQETAIGAESDSYGGGLSIEERSPAEMTGPDALESMDGLDAEATWESSDVYPALRWQGVSVTDVAVDADAITVGETVTVTASFRNADREEATHEAELRADGESVATESVTVEGGGIVERELAWTPGEPGTYQLSVDGVDAGSVTVEEAASEDDDTGTDDEPEDDGSNMTLLVLLGAGALLGVGYFARERL